MYKRGISKKTRLLTIITALFILSIPTTSQINNCCSVDRQCNTDEEWISGWWAFQNNQCTAPSQQPQSTATSTQRQSDASGDVDNCCFIGWQCNTNAEWTSGYWAFQHNQCGAAPSQWQEQWSQIQRRQKQGLNAPKPNGWGGWCPPDCVYKPISVEYDEEERKYTYTYLSRDGTAVEQIDVWHHTWEEFCELVEDEHPNC